MKINRMDIAGTIKKTRLLQLLITVQLLGCDFGNQKSTQVTTVDTLSSTIDSTLHQPNLVSDEPKKKLDTIPEINEELMQRAVISKSDSSFHVYNNIRADYRIFGYQFPDTTSKKMVLFSVFTTDVKDNSYHCTYGSYYGSPNLDELMIKYTGEAGSFVAATITDSKQHTNTIYFEKKWVEFE